MTFYGKVKKALLKLAQVLNKLLTLISDAFDILYRIMYNCVGREIMFTNTCNVNNCAIIMLYL